MNYPGLIPSQSEPLWCKPWVCSDWSEPCSWLFPHMDSAWTLHWHYTVYSVFPPSSRSIFTLHSPAEESPQCGIPLDCPHSTVNAPWSTIHPHSASTLILALTPLKLLFISNLAYPAKHIAWQRSRSSADVSWGNDRLQPCKHLPRKKAQRSPEVLKTKVLTNLLPPGSFSAF